MTERVSATTGGRRPRRAGRSKTDLLDAAARVIRERGADATRFTDVAEASSVPVSSLQYYFGSREDLLVASFRHASETELADLAAKLRKIDDPWHRLTVIVHAAISGLDLEQGQSGLLWIESWRFAMRDEELRRDVIADYAQWRALITAAVADGQARGEFDAELDPHLVSVQALALVDGMCLPAALRDPQVSVEQGRALALQALAAILGYRPIAKASREGEPVAIEQGETQPQ